MVDYIGTYYSTPLGVVYTVAYNQGEVGPAITYVRLVKTTQFRNFYSRESILREKTADWVRLDIEDFPNSADKQLPYVFDLFFDIKRMSHLRRAFQYENSKKLLEMMRKHNIQFERRNKHAKPRRY